MTGSIYHLTILDAQVLLSRQRRSSRHHLLCRMYAEMFVNSVCQDAFEKLHKNGNLIEQVVSQLYCNRDQR